jgi:hypothetical protein
MKTWAMMYGIIWVAFFQIIIVLFPLLGQWPADLLHGGLGVVLFAFAYQINGQVRATSCPARIKRIVRATLMFCTLQAVLGLVLFGLLLSGLGGDLALGGALFLHVAVALTIITQASSSATAYDMWEEREFEVPSATIPQSANST